MLIDKKPFKEAMFDRDSIIFLIAVVIIEAIACYVIEVRKARKQ